MATPRRFARFRATIPTGDPGLWTVPDRGLCLSAFVLVTERNYPARVLAGRINPRAHWDQLGSLDETRRKGLDKAWMLPASQLLFFESPKEAAARIVREMLELPDLPLDGPRVESESYGRPDLAGRDLHWDVHFLFAGTLDAKRLGHPSAWSELRFVEVSATPRETFARSHGDILDLVGLHPK